MFGFFLSIWQLLYFGLHFGLVLRISELLDEGFQHLRGNGIFLHCSSFAIMSYVNMLQESLMIEHLPFLEYLAWFLTP